VDFYLTWHTSSLTNNQNLAHFFEKTLAIPKNKKTWHRKPGTSGNWGSGISPSIRGDTVFKWTHQLQKEADSLERSLHCARGARYPRRITRGREPSDQESVSNGKITLAREHN